MRSCIKEGGGGGVVEGVRQCVVWFEGTGVRESVRQ